MGIFGTKAGNRTEAAGAADVFTAPERERIEALWRLTALPRAEFDATYGAMLDGFWRYAASARGEAWAALRRAPIKMRQFIFTHTSGPVPRPAVLGVGGVQ